MQQQQQQHQLQPLLGLNRGDTASSGNYLGINSGIKYDHFAKKHMKQSQVARHWLKIHQAVLFHYHLINFLIQS